MNAVGIVRLAVASALALSAASAMGASDYLLEIKGVAGASGASDASQTIEVSSFSWGTSNPTSVGSGGLSAGRMSTQDMAVATAAPPKVGDVASFTVTYRESPTRASTGKTSWACAAGEHIKEAVLTAQGKRYEMQDVVVTSCATSNGQRRKELTGHVTLIK